MNSSLWSANRNTHLKIVAVSLVAGIAVVVVGINSRLNNSSSMTAKFQEERAVVKAKTPTSVAGNDLSRVR